MGGLGNSTDRYLESVSAADPGVGVHDSLRDLVSTALETGGVTVGRAGSRFDLTVSDSLAIEVEIDLPETADLRSMAKDLVRDLSDEGDVERLLVLYANGPRADRLRLEFDPGPLRFQRLDEFFERLRYDAPMTAIARIEEQGHVTHPVVGEVVRVEPTPAIRPLDTDAPIVPLDVDVNINAGDHLAFTYGLQVDDVPEVAVAAIEGEPAQEPVVKHISAWVGEDEDDSAAVMLDQESSLSFKVGDACPASLFEGHEATIPLSDIPEAGLDTAWTVRAEGAVFSPSAGVHVLADDPGTVTFDLHVPQIGDSATVTMTFMPRTVGTLRFDALLRAGGRLYRRLAAEVEVGEPEGALEVKVDTPFVRADSILGLPARDPEYIDITLLAGATALVRGRLPDGTTLNTSVRWNLTARELDDLFAGVRSAADGVRENHGAYLDDLPSEELEELLRRFEPVEDWTAASDGAGERHLEAWAELRSSKALRNLAEAGHVAYNAIFPKKGELRAWVDALSPGGRLSINTALAEAGAPADVPWALLYLPRVEDEIDGAGFVGLRFRVVSYAYQPVTPANAFLGDANKAIKALCLFWGAETPTAEETQRQRETVGTLPGAVLVPSPDATNPRAALLSYLTKPDQTPPAVLYFFCHYGRIPPDEQGFRFGDDIEERSVVTTRKLGAEEAHGAPLVFANACATGAVDAYHASQVTRYFLTNGASAYLGTEVRVPPVLASRFATAFFSIFQPTGPRAPLTACEALAQTRRFLWTKYRNLGGLFYTYVNEPDLRLVAAPVR